MARLAKRIGWQFIGVPPQRLINKVIANQRFPDSCREQDYHHLSPSEIAGGKGNDGRRDFTPFVLGAVTARALPDVRLGSKRRLGETD
jgi:hypothetical protein